MAGQQLGLRGEFHDSADGIDQIVVVGAGEVGSAVCAADNQVAADQDILLGEVETDVSGSVAGCVDDLGRKAAQRQELAIFDELVG